MLIHMRTRTYIYRPAVSGSRMGLGPLPVPRGMIEGSRVRMHCTSTCRDVYHTGAGAIKAVMLADAAVETEGEE